MKAFLLRMKDFGDVTASVISKKNHNITGCLPTT